MTASGLGWLTLWRSRSNTASVGRLRWRNEADGGQAPPTLRDALDRLAIVYRG